MDWRDMVIERLTRRSRHAKRYNERDKEIMTLWKTGDSTEEISKMYYISTMRVRQIVRALHLQEFGRPPPHRERRPPPTAERNKEIYRRFVAGEKKAHIARQYNLSPAMISIIVFRAERRAAGVPCP
jgi:Mor family transcriptional regulator